MRERERHLHLRGAGYHRVRRQFSYRTGTGSMGCSDATLGDPIASLTKTCYYKSTVLGTG